MTVTTNDPASPPPLTALDRLERGLSAAAKTLPMTSVSGVVTEIAMSHYRVAGLSRFLRLGECVRVDVGDRFQLGEVVRIDDQSVTLKPFDSRCDAVIGARAYRAEALSLAPCPAWKGRAIDALGQPIDGAGKLPVGDRVMPIDGEPPPALQRTRLRKPIKSGIRVVDFFTPLCAGQRIGIFAGSGVGKSTMLAMLARAPDLRAVARASAFQLREKNVSARSVGRDLGAGVLLEGSIRGSPDHLKIAAQLVSAASGFDLWSESWEGPAGDAPLFEERIVHAVRQVLGKTGKRAPAASAAAIRPPLPGAQEAYWRGRYLLSKGHETRAGSIRFLEEAARADPQFAPAWAGLATAYATMAFHMEEDDVGQLVAKARSAGGRALQLDPASAETLASLAVLSYAFDHDWPGAERGFERALELNPSYARGHLQYAMGLLTRARFDAAIAHIRAARALDPLSYAIGNDLATALECAGRYDEAIASARQPLRNAPTFAFAHVPLGDALAMKGDSTAAIAEFEQAIRTLGRGGWILGPMGYALARAGSKVQAANVAREIGSQDGSGVHLAHIYAGLGDKPRALDALERANAQRIVDLNFMAVDPMLASLRTEPRFLTLKGRLGL